MGKIHFVLMLNVAFLVDFVQFKLILFNALPVVGWAIYIAATALISLFAWLTFFTWITVLERTPRAYGRARRALKTQIKGPQSLGRRAKARSAVDLAQNPTRYIVMRAVTYMLTLFFETTFGVLPTFTIMVLVIYLVNGLEARVRKVLGDSADQLALAAA
jgi:hypothetical protein